MKLVLPKAPLAGQEGAEHPLGSVAQGTPRVFPPPQGSCNILWWKVPSQFVLDYSQIPWLIFCYHCSCLQGNLLTSLPVGHSCMFSWLLSPTLQCRRGGCLVRLCGLTFHGDVTCNSNCWALKWCNSSRVNPSSPLWWNVVAVYPLVIKTQW